MTLQVRLLLSDKKQSDVYGSCHDSRSGLEDGHHTSRHHDIHLPHCIRIQQVHFGRLGSQDITKDHARWWSHGHSYYQHHVWFWPFHGVVLLMVGLEWDPSGTADAAEDEFPSAPSILLFRLP